MKRQWLFSLTRLLAELIILITIFVLCKFSMDLLQWPIPPGILGLVILLCIFALGWLKPEQLQLGAAFLMGEMLLFFIPALMSLLDYGVLVKNQGWKIIVIILISTVLVMLATATVVELVYRWNLMRHWRKRHDH